MSATMNKLFSVLLFLILIGGGIVSEVFIHLEDEKETSGWGLFVVAVLIIAGILYYFIPKTKLAKVFEMNEAVFVVLNILGIVFGGVGLLSIFVFDPLFVRSVLWKLIILPYALCWIYIALIMRIERTTEIYDEKQNFDMTQGAGVTLGVMIYFVAVIISPLMQSGLLSIRLFMPCYIFSTIFFFSLITLMMYKLK